MTLPLQPSETELVGKWLAAHEGVVGDEVTKRIRALVENELTHVADSAYGWDRLYQDPRDGRYWEETYPESWQHGGGPPRLASIDVEEAKARYHIET